MAKIKKMMELEENGDEQQFFPQTHADAVLDLHEYLKKYVIPGAVNGKDGKDGTNGLSAYDIAVIQGFKGTATEWINSLKGDKGPAGVAPTIGSNGNWVINGVDSGKPSRGATGSAGATPTIGSNGNWFINGVDSGKPSRGVQGDKGDGMQNVSYRLTTLVEKPEFSDGDVGAWFSAGQPCVFENDGLVDGYNGNAASQKIGSDLYASQYFKPVASGSRWYAEVLVPNFDANKNTSVNVSLHYIDPSTGKSAWQIIDTGTVTVSPQHWRWIRGYVTVPDKVTKVRPCISMKREDNTNIIAHVKYCQFTLVNAGVQTQLNELNNKIIKITKVKDV